MQTQSRIMLCSALMLASVTAANANESHCMSDVGEQRAATPDNVFVQVNNDVISHTETGLQWARCAIGQQANASQCSGQATAFTWHEAGQAVATLNRQRYAGHADWRLPSVEELKSLVENCREAPSINTTIFSNTPWAGFWTSSLHEDRQNEYKADHVDTDAKFGAHKDDNEEEVKDGPEAWFVGFYQGLEYPYSMQSSYRVRPVRTP
ncbi:MAG: DUF1566 domain-containing protein [Wenzhouxiangellaceae bacterium]|nr:DUF1566 domain-containing protein [Wenzhouxiangellaceae bacterium]